MGLVSVWLRAHGPPLLLPQLKAPCCQKPGTRSKIAWSWQIHLTTGRILTHEYRACNVRKLLSRARALMDEEHLRREDFEVQLPLLPLHFLSISHLLHHSFFQLFSPSPAFLDSIPSHHCDPPGRWRNTAQRRQRESVTPGTSKSTTKSFRLCAKLFAQA